MTEPKINIGTHRATIHHRSNKLPEHGQYVVAHYAGGNWGDADDQFGCEWKVVKFLRGISEAKREALKFSSKAQDLERSLCIHSEDQHGNNLEPYCWDEFGPGRLLGQDVDYWFALPERSVFL